MSWIGRTPLMPLLAGIAATGVIAAAFSTRQISLNFAGKSPAIEEAKIPRNDDVRPSRSAARSPLTVRFRVAGLPSGGFTGTV
ncbi:MAG: hypothetical protein ABIS86_02235, partial [Streptosporangiaceae bacterium]